MKVYVFYTAKIQKFIDILQESGKEIEGVELVPELHEIEYDHCELGQTNGEGYLELCLQSHLYKLKIMKENMGSNIVFLDADIVFNKNQNNFTKIITELLAENDFLFQHDDNSAMCEGINLGIIAVKCNDQAIALWEAHCLNISRIPPQHRVGGFPQTEFNLLIREWKDKIKFQHLSLDFGFLTDNCIVYHAIGVENKMSALQNALKSFGQ